MISRPLLGYSPHCKPTGACSLTNWPGNCRLSIGDRMSVFDANSEKKSSSLEILFADVAAAVCGALIGVIGTLIVLTLAAKEVGL